MTTQHEEACPEIGPICAVRAEPPQVHDQTVILSELTLRGDYRFNETWSLSGVLPIRAVRTTIVFRDLAGNPLSLDYENIHHRDATLVGVADPFLIGRAETKLGELRLHADVGLSLPLGRTETDPFVAAEEGEAHEHLQFGTGTYRPIFGTGALIRLDRVDVSSWGLAILSLYENQQRYRAGHRLAAGLNVSAAFDDLVLRAGGEAQAETAERWSDAVPVSDGNQGRVDVLVTAGLSYALDRAWSIRADAKVPVYTHVENGQLEYPVLIDIGVARSFSF